MELNAIAPFPYQKLYSVKIVSDSLDKNLYESFNYSECLDEVFKIIDILIK